MVPVVRRGPDPSSADTGCTMAMMCTELRSQVPPTAEAQHGGPLMPPLEPCRRMLAWPRAGAPDRAHAGHCAHVSTLTKGASRAMGRLITPQYELMEGAAGQSHTRFGLVMRNRLKCPVRPHFRCAGSSSCPRACERSPRCTRLPRSHDRRTTQSPERSCKPWYLSLSRSRLIGSR